MAKIKSNKEKSQINESVQVDEGIYLIKKTQPENKFSKNKAVFTILGKHKVLDNYYPALSDTDDDLDIAYAKFETVRGKTKFFIKTDDDGLLFNPISPDANTTDFKFRVMKNQGHAWKYQSVTEECFYQYLEFLKTKNTLYLKYAQRIYQ